MKQRIEIEVDIPEGYEATGEYRPAKAGEFSFDPETMKPFLEREGCFYARIILRRKEPLAIQACRMAAGYFDKNTPWFEIKRVCDQAIAEYEREQKP